MRKNEAVSDNTEMSSEVEEKKHLIVETLSPEETEAVGRLVGEHAGTGLFVGLCGELGSGKTVFVRGMARGLGISGNITSPTFQLMREYQGREKLYHFDFYRLGEAGDVADLDISGSLETGVAVAEWNDRFPGFTGGDYLLVRIEWTGETARKLKFIDAGGAGDYIIEEIRKHYEEQKK